MEILIVRKWKREKFTISELFVDGLFECFILEDKDRGLDSGMSIEDILKIKVPEQTAIPTGRYELIVNFSNRFKQYMPLLLEVKGFAGVRIHSGNTHQHTEGCPLTGTTKDEVKGFVGNSRAAYRSLFAKIKKVEKTEKVFVTIK